MYVSSQQINIISTDHKLKCSTQFQSHMVYMGPPNGIFYWEVVQHW